MKKQQNAASESAVKESATKAKRSKDQELEDLRLLLKTPHFRRFIWRYIAICDRISAHQSGSWTYFNEGERNIANQIKAEVVAAAPEALLQMMQENKEP